MNENVEELADFAKDILEEGINVTISRKDGVMLFGAIIAANVATVFVLQGMTRVLKRFVTSDSDED